MALGARSNRQLPPHRSWLPFQRRPKTVTQGRERNDNFDDHDNQSSGGEFHYEFNIGNNRSCSPSARPDHFLCGSRCWPRNDLAELQPNSGRSASPKQRGDIHRAGRSCNATNNSFNDHNNQLTESRVLVTPLFPVSSVPIQVSLDHRQGRIQEPHPRHNRADASQDRSPSRVCVNRGRKGMAQLVLLRPLLHR